MQLRIEDAVEIEATPTVTRGVDGKDTHHTLDVNYIIPHPCKLYVNNKHMQFRLGE